MLVSQCGGSPADVLNEMCPCLSVQGSSGRPGREWGQDTLLVRRCNVYGSVSSC